MDNVMNALNNTPFLDLSQVIGCKKENIPAIIPVSRAVWFKGMASGLYPKPVKISTRRVAWKRSDIEALIKRLGGE